ncbi:MAG: T9SS C-terminal target domain-containing protein [Calditrichaeota bacterium]|nr:MAG: T9SS C-terminal target domain-containing protein [Calditrichota bacterium]
MLRAGKWFSALGATVVLLTGLFLAIARAQDATVNRPFEPIVLTGRSFADFSGDQVPVGELFLFAYDAATQSWIQVPMQIDQVDTAGSFFTDQDGLLDDNDQIVFMAADGKDQAPFNQWIDDAEARNFPRYEIQLTDPMNPSGKTWLYLYRSTALHHDAVKSYMKYIPAPADKPAADTIQGMSYIQSHNVGNGLPDYLAIPESAGGNGLDIMDRLKTRIKGKFLFFSLNISENDFGFKMSNVKQGPVRIIRKSIIGLNFINQEFNIEIVIKFYPYSEIISGNLPLDSNLGLSLLRVSVDLNRNANGMQFYNQNNGPVLVDANNDNVNLDILTAPDLNWDMTTGDPGTIVKIVKINMDSLQNADPSLYYWDSSAGDTQDNTDDTGDTLSYADSGIKISKTSSGNITGKFPIFIESFFLAANQDKAMGEQLRDQVANPLNTLSTQQKFDAVPPARISDLNVIAATDFTLSFEWTAPGDDSLSGGPAAAYTLYYSTVPLESDTLGWLQNATKVTDGLPTPAAPGTPQQFTLENLQSQVTYYSVITAVDDFGNESPLSNVAFKQTTVAVQLVSFRSSVIQNEIHLSWQVGANANPANFAIERRQGSQPAWEEIGVVRSKNDAGNSYNFIDRVTRPGTYFYRLRQNNANGQADYSAEIQAEVAVPQQAQLSQNYPNPFRLGQTSVIRYSLPSSQPQPVTVRVYNLLGQDLGALFSGRQSAGFYQISWDGRLASGVRVSPGVYFLVLETPGQRVIRKLTIMPY